MIGFRAEPNHIAPGPAVALVLLGLGLGFGGATVAQAQESATAPIRLFPRTDLQPPAVEAEPTALGLAEPAAPETNAPGTDVQGTVLSAPAEAGLPVSIPRPRLGGIEINSLAEVSPETIGVLGPREGGFGLDMWRGTDRSVARPLLARLPGDMPSPAMHDMARRLLLSVTAPPAGAGAGSGPGGGVLVAGLGIGPSPSVGAESNGAESNGIDFLTLRIERLMALGDIPAFNRLLDAVPVRQETQAIGRARVDGLWLAGNYDGACKLVRGRIGQYHAEVYWQKALVFCQFLAGEVDQGMLGLDLLREQGGADDALFFALADALGGGEPEALPAGDPSPLHLAMMLAAGLPMDTEMPQDAAPAILYALARAASAPPETRVLAAERACARGMIDGAALGEAYDSFIFKPDDLSNALSEAAAQEGPRARALLYQAARDETIPATRAEVLRVALERAVEDGTYQASVAALSPMLRELPVTPELAWLATAAGRALYAAGEPEQASAWLTLGRQEAILNPQASTAVAALWPYSRLAGRGSQTASGDLAAWGDIRVGIGDPVPPRARSLLRAAFQALGERDPMAWAPIAATAEAGARPMPDAAFVFALGDASEAGRVGETVLLSLIVLGERGPAGSHVLALESVISALRRVGLDAEARALAIEAAIASGV